MLTLLLRGGSVEVRDGGVIQSIVTGTAKGAPILIQAGDVTLSDAVLVRTFALSGTGDGGDISVAAAGRLRLADATIETRSVTSGGVAAASF